MALQHLRSGTAHKRPIPTVMSAGQIAINTNEASPGLFFKDSNGDLVKVGPVHIGTTAPNSSPDSVAATALVTGTVYQILTVGTSDFTLVGASANTVGTIFTATGTTTGTGTVSGQQGVEKGEQWLDTTGGAYDLKIYDGTSWRSQAGEFVNVTGDTMTGALLLDNAASVSAPDLSFDGDANTGIYSPGADQFGVATAGTAALTIDSSQRVGIGSTSPAANLDVLVNSASDSEVRVRNNTDGLRLMMQADGTSLIRSVFNRGIIFGSGTSNADTTLAERMRIDSSGNVGIGESTPLGKLHIKTADSGIASVGSSADDLVIESDTNAGITLVSNTENAINFADSGDVNVGQIAYNHSSNYMSFRANDSERMRIDSSGNVGIGTDDPQTISHIYGADPVLRIQDNSTPIADAFAAIQLAESVSGGGLGNYWQIALEGDSSTSSDHLTFKDGTGERMRIDSSGNVGIGTSSPSEKLEVNSGTGNTALKLVSTDSAVYMQLADDATTSANRIGAIGNDVVFHTNGSEQMRIDSSGDLLLGTSSPFSTVSNRTQVHLNGAADVKVGFGVGGTIRQNIYTDATNMSIINQTSTGYIRLNTNDTERMRIDSSGNLLVGTTSPGAGAGFATKIAVSGSDTSIFKTTGVGATSAAPLRAWHDATTGNNLLVMLHTDTSLNTRGTITYNRSSNLVQYNTTSDARLKTNIIDAPSALNLLDGVRVKSFDWIEEGHDRVEYGFIAQELNEVIPSAVNPGDNNNEVTEEWGVDNSKIVPLLTKALQEAIAKIETLEQRLTDAGL